MNDNMYRSIIIAKAGRHWIYAYLYAKKDRENIAPDELAAFLCGDVYGISAGLPRQAGIGTREEGAGGGAD